MKKLISLFLTVLMIASCFAVTSLTVGAADNSSGFELTYDQSLNGLNETKQVERVAAVGGRTGFVAKLTSSGTTSGYIGKNYLKNNEGNSAGIWVLETDMYVGSGAVPEGATMYFWVDPTENWGALVRTSFEKTKSTNSTISMDSYPTDKWFTVRFVFDYTSATADTATLYIEYDGEARTVDRFGITSANWQNNGLGRIRIGVGGTADKNGVAYLDNTRYYQISENEMNVYSVTNKGELYYYEDFDTGITYNFTAIAATGNISAIRSKPNLLATANDPVNSSNKVLHYLCNGRQDFITRTDFKAPLTGTQVAEVKLYIPTTGDNSVNSAAEEDIVVDLAVDGANSWGATAYGVRLGRNAGYSKTTDNSGRAAFLAPLDKWFTLRFIINYNNGIIESQIIEDGVVVTKGTKAMPATVKSGGIKRLFFARGEVATVTEYYVDDIKYYQVDNIPFEIDFDRNVSVTSPDYTVTSGSIATAPNGNNGKSLKITAAAVEAGEDVAQQLINFDTRLYPIGVKDGIVEMDASFYIAKGFVGENERIVLIPNTDNLTTIDASAVGTAINPNSGALASNTAQIWSDGIIIKNSTNKISYPKNEWFKIRCTYNINTNLMQYHLVEADGTTTFIGEAVETGNFAAYAKNTGVKRLRIQYFKPPKLELPEDVEFYIDNIKFSNATWGDIALADNGSYTASVDYSAQGEVVTNTKLMVMQYNAANELVAINIYTPTFADGNGVYKVENIAKAAGATSAKLAYWDSLSGATPLAVATN